MNSENVSAQLTAAINTSITNGDLAAPLDIPRTVRDMLAPLSAAEGAGNQHAADLAWNNAVAGAVRSGQPTGAPFDPRE